MSQTKNSFIELKMSSQGKQPEDTGIAYYSADFLTAKQQFKLIDDDTNEALKLDNLRYAQLTLAPNFNFRCTKEKVTLELELIKEEEALFKVILPVSQLWLKTDIRGEVVAFYDTGEGVSPSLHIGQFIMRFEQSMIDMEAGERETHWVTTFAETHDKLITKANATIEELENMVVQGPPGADGRDGLSAFEIAVEKGFVGTEQEWLESLRGADGKDGQDGRDGAIGPQGNDGAPGTDGQSIHFPLNHFTSDMPPNVYPLGVSQTTVGGVASGFPFNGSIKTFVYEDGKAEQYGSTLSGQRWFRVGSTIAWQGISGGWRRLPDIPTVAMPESQFNPDTAIAGTIYFLI